MGEPQLEREGSEVPLATGETIERHAKPQPEQVTGDGLAGRGPEQSREVPGRDEDLTGDLVEPPPFGGSTRQKDTRSLDGAPLGPAERTSSRVLSPRQPTEDGPKEIEPLLLRRERIDGAVAQSGSRPVQPRSDIGLYEANDPGDPVRADGVLSALRRKCEDDALVAVGGRMTDPVVIPGPEDDRAHGIGDGDVATPMDLEAATEGEDHLRGQRVLLLRGRRLLGTARDVVEPQDRSLEEWLRPPFAHFAMIGPCRPMFRGRVVDGRIRELHGLKLYGSRGLHGGAPLSRMQPWSVLPSSGTR